MKKFEYLDDKELAELLRKPTDFLSDDFMANKSGQIAEGVARLLQSGTKINEKSFLKHVELRFERIEKFPLTYKEFLSIYEQHVLEKKHD